MLLDCLQEISANLRHALPRLAVERSMKKRAQRLSTELLQNSNMPRSDRAQRELDSLREKLIFFASCCGGVQFEYDTISQSVLVVDWSRPGKQSRTIMDVNDPDNMRPLRPADVARLRSALKATTPENNELSISVLLPVAGEQHWHSIRLHTLWSPLSPGSYVGVIGCMTDTQKEQSSHAPLCCADKSTANRPLIVEDMQRLSRIFDVVRLVDPSANAVLELDADGTLHRTGERCAAFWDTDCSCANCISSRALAEHTTLNKLEFTRNEMYFVISRYVSVNGTPCVLEMVSRLNEGRWIDANGSRAFLLDRTRGEDMQLFLDPLTGVYARRYFETYRTHLEGMEGVALIDVNSFKPSTIPAATPPETRAARHRGRDTLVHPQDRHPHPLRRGRVPAPVPAHDRGDLPREEKSRSSRPCAASECPSSRTSSSRSASAASAACIRSPRPSARRIT